MILFMADPPSGVEVQERQNAPRPFIDNDLGAHARHHILQGLDIDAAAGNHGALMYSATRR